MLRIVSAPGKPGARVLQADPAAAKTRVLQQVWPGHAVLHLLLHAGGRGAGLRGRRAVRAGVGLQQGAKGTSIYLWWSEGGKGGGIFCAGFRGRRAVRARMGLQQVAQGTAIYL